MYTLSCYMLCYVKINLEIYWASSCRKQIIFAINKEPNTLNKILNKS